MTSSPAAIALMRWHLLGLMKHTMVFGLMLLLLPLTGFRAVPGHGYLGGLFIDHTFQGGVLAAFQLVGAAWGLMYGQGLVIGAARDKYGARVGQGEAVIDRGWEELLNVPIVPKQFWLYTGLAGPGLLVSILGSRAWPDHPVLSVFLGGLAALLGGGLSFLAWQLLFLPVMMARWKLLAQDREAYLQRESLAAGAPEEMRLFYGTAWFFRHVWTRLPFSLLRGPAAAFYQACSGLLRPVGRVVAPLRALETEDGLDPRHFAALSVVGPLALGYLLAGLLLEDGKVLAVYYLYTLLALCIWTLTAVDFYATVLFRRPVPAFLATAGAVLAGYSLFGAGHGYRTTLPERPEASNLPLLDPVEVMKASREGEHLVVITSTGGGIYAAGWTSLMLKRLCEADPAFLDRTRLVSSVSGSSVAMAFLAEAQLRQPQQPRREQLAEVLRGSTGSSLSAAARGLAYPDFWRLASCGLWPWGADAPFTDRGRLQELSWIRNAGAGSSPPRALSDLRGAIRAGQLPAMIFNASVMETGERIMITPADFHPGARQARGRTHSKLLRRDMDGTFGADLSLWTAARLSATFPYVSPMARGIPTPATGPWGEGAALHLGDGGYVDNYGVASALDWLDPLLEARAAGHPDLRFRKVLILQIRAFRPKKAGGAGETWAAFLGPALAQLGLHAGVLDRNEIELARFLAHWNARLKGQGVALSTVVLQPDQGTDPGPMSWHLTAHDIELLRTAGDPDHRDCRTGLPSNPELRAAFDCLQRLLANP